MDPETSAVPVAERPSERHEPLHLRYFALLRSNVNFRCERHQQQPIEAGAPAKEPAAKSPLREGWNYFRANPKITVLVLAKTGQGCVGGVLLLLAVFGERIFPIAGQGALAMGLLYSARGTGAGVGPLVGDILTRGTESRMWKSISLSFLVMGTAYIAFGQAPTLVLAALAVFFGHMGASNIWVTSTALLQLNSEDRFRGRVFAVDFGMNMLAAAASNFVLGLGLDSWGLSARQLASSFGLVLLIPGLFWLPAQAKWGRRIDRFSD